MAADEEPTQRTPSSARQDTDRQGHADDDGVPDPDADARPDASTEQDTAPDVNNEPHSEPATTSPPRPAWRNPYLLAGLLFIVIGASGLAVDYTQDWFVENPEREIPILGLINEGAPLNYYDREDLVDAYADATFYAQGYVFWPWVGYVTAILGGIALALSLAFGRLPRFQTGWRGFWLLAITTGATLMAVSVARRFGRQFMDRVWNDVDIFWWGTAAKVQAIACIVLLAVALTLLIRLWLIHRPDHDPRHHPQQNAIKLHTITIGIVVLALVSAPFYPFVELERPEIVGNAWIGEDSIHGNADRDNTTLGTAAQGYVGATRALWVSATTALVSLLGTIGWVTASTKPKRIISGLIAQTHLIAILPLHLGSAAFDLFVQGYIIQRNYTMLSNVSIIMAIDLLMILWVASVAWLLLPWLRLIRGKPTDALRPHPDNPPPPPSGSAEAPTQ